MRHPTTAQLGGQRGAARRSTAPRTLHVLMAALDISDIELARRLDVSRQAVHSRRTGRTSMTADDLADVATALDVDPAIMLGPPHEALRWLVENRADQLDGVLVSLGNGDRQHNGGELDENSDPVHRNRAKFPCRAKHVARPGRPTHSTGITQRRGSATGRRSLSATT